jgi:methionine sulfoxide reductase heme-binding subunit
MRSLNNSYLIIGPGLILFYVLQYIFYEESQALIALQNQSQFKTITGLLLLVLILIQWGLTFARLGKHKLAESGVALSFHKWMGALSPLLLYVHSIKIGNGYLAILSIVFIGNLVLGFLSIGKIKSIGITYFRTWVFLHTLFSVVILVFTFYHIWVVLYFE